MAERCVGEISLLQEPNPNPKNILTTKVTKSTAYFFASPPDIRLFIP